MGKKAILFIVVGVVLGVALAGGGVFFMLQNAGGEEPDEPTEPVEEVFDLTQGKRLSLEKVQIPLKATGSKTNYLQADFTIIFKSEEALTKAESMIPDIRDAIYGVFETKTAAELNGTDAPENEEPVSKRNAMKEPVLNAIRGLYFNEEEKEEVVGILIPAFIIV